MRVQNFLRYSNSYRKSGIFAANQNIVYRVISQTQKYPQFIPFVKSSTIVRKISEQQNHTKLAISYGSFTDLAYTSHVKMRPPQKDNQGKAIIHSICHEQPLKKLESLWEIQPRGNDKAYVNYKLEFQFVSFVYKMAAGVVKDYMGEQLWNIFQKRSMLEQVRFERQAKDKSHPQSASASSQNPNNPEQAIHSNSSNNPQLLHFLNKKPQYKVMYNENPNWRKKIQQFHYKYQKQKDYQPKMQVSLKHIKQKI